MEEGNVYVYTLVKEDWNTGKRSARRRKYHSSHNELTVGGLYCHLGSRWPGFYRVLSVETVSDPVS